MIVCEIPLILSLFDCSAVTSCSVGSLGGSAGSVGEMNLPTSENSSHIYLDFELGIGKLS